MADPSKSLLSSDRRSHQPNSDDDDEAIAGKHLSRKKNKRVIPSTDDAEPSNLSTVCTLSPSQAARITEPFNRCLIACVVGRRVSGQYLDDRLHRFLPLTGTLAVAELGRGFFVLRFSQSSDYNEALKSRPWSIPNFCISVFPWIPNFRPSETPVPYADVWIRLPELCIEYYDKEVLQQIADAIGGLVKIDPITERLEKCKFARLCVKLNICNPLPSEIKLGSIRQRIEYEGLYLLCSHCRRVGVGGGGDVGKHDCFTNPFDSGFDSHHHRAYSYQHPNCRQNQAIGSSSNQQPLIPSEKPSPLGSRSQVLEKDALLAMGKRETAAATSTPSPHVSVNLAPAPSLVQKKYHSPGSKAKAVANQREISGASVQLQTLPIFPKEAARRVKPVSIKSPELRENSLIRFRAAKTSNPIRLEKDALLAMSERQTAAATREISGASVQLQTFPKENSLIQSMAMAEDKFRAAKTSNPASLADHNNQPQSSLTVSSTPSPQPQPCPVSEASLELFSKVTQLSTTEKEMSSTPSRETSVNSRPSVLTIKETVTSVAIRVSKASTTLSNQDHYAVELVPTSRDDGSEAAVSVSASSRSSKKVLYWNYHGRTDITMLKRALKDLIQLHRPSIVLVFGTKISAADADQVLQEFSSSDGGSYRRKPDGYSGGIWLLLSQQDVQVQVHSQSSQQISASVYFHSRTKKPMLTETPSQPWGPTFFYTSPNLIDNTLAC